jgi:hypothetical protein
MTVRGSSSLPVGPIWMLVSIWEQGATHTHVKPPTTASGAWWCGLAKAGRSGHAPRVRRPAGYLDCGEPSLTVTDRTMWHGCGTRDFGGQ